MVNEAARLYYLDVLGVDVFVERREQVDDSPQQTVTPEVARAAPPPSPMLRTAPPEAPDPQEWQELKATVASCTRCALHGGRTQTVFGVGNPAADWMVIGEAPGQEEDRRGEPFVGRAGKLLDEMLRAVHLGRDSVFIANILKCRPPNNRDPSAAEADACRPHLDRQIALVNPRLILAVGRVAAQQLLGSDAPVGKLRGRVHYLAHKEIPVVVTYHPAYLLRSPKQKREAWKDLCLARRAMSAPVT